MITKTVMPKLGETMEEGTIGKWLKKEGDKIEKGQVLLEVITDKANFEVESLKSGFVRKILLPEGAVVKVTETIAYIADAMSEDIPVEVKKTEAEVKPVVETRPEAAKTNAAPSGFVSASPLAKKLAKDKGIDLTKVKGTGPNGRITEKDILDFNPGASAGSAPVEGVKVIPLSNMRKIIAQRLSKSKQEAPHFYLQAEIDMTEVAKQRETAKKQGSGVSLNDYIVVACAKALKEFPLINSHFANNEIRQFSDVNIGVAVSLEEGLVVPVFKKCAGKSLEAISKEVKALAEKAKANKLSGDDMANGTFTISNMGMLKVDSFSAIINPPQVAILAVSSIKQKPAVIADKIEIRAIMNVTLSVDHRAVDGSYAAKFLDYLRGVLQGSIK